LRGHFPVKQNLSVIKNFKPLVVHRMPSTARALPTESMLKIKFSFELVDTFYITN
jgi:hypothetical protein